MKLWDVHRWNYLPRVLKRRLAKLNPYKLTNNYQLNWFNNHGRSVWCRRYVYVAISRGYNRLQETLSWYTIIMLIIVFICQAIGDYLEKKPLNKNQDVSLRGWNRYWTKPANIVKNDIAYVSLEVNAFLRTQQDASNRVQKWNVGEFFTVRRIWNKKKERETFCGCFENARHFCVASSTTLIRATARFSTRMRPIIQKQKNQANTKRKNKMNIKKLLRHSGSILY